MSFRRFLLNVALQLLLVTALIWLTLPGRAQAQEADQGSLAVMRAAKDAGMLNTAVERLYGGPVTNNAGTELRVYRLVATDEDGPGQFLVVVGLYQGEVTGTHSCSALRDVDPVLK